MIIIFDFEVFMYDWLVVFKHLDSNQHDVIINDVKKLRDYYEKNKNYIFCGFNNKSYDNIIFKGLLSGLNAYSMSNNIIEHNIRRFKLKKFKLKTIDLSQDLLQSISLKTIEANLGIDIEETQVDFNIPRNLTEKEIESTVKYCKYDVDATEKLFFMRYESYIKPKLLLMKAFNLEDVVLEKTNAQLTAEILDARRRRRFDEFKFDKIDCINVNNVDVLELYKTPLDYEKTLNVKLNGVEHVLGYGGLHGALKNIHEKDDLLNLDVTSYYPSMMIEYNFHSRNIKDTRKYIDIYKDRLKFKKNKNKDLSTAYKLILNTTYGSMKNKYNALYDPKMANQICVTGQLLLIDLIEKLEPYCKLI
jgi:hypothetical protein